MQRIRKLKNTIQTYAWGSTTAIPDLLGTKNRDQQPQAELWMGAHPKAPSMIQQNGEWVSLLDFIVSNPSDILGPKVATKFDNQLPYLLKVLAAAKPLSIQAHPDREQAKAGFARENSRGIPMDAFERNYKDDHHKPECLCALTSFWGLCGFRKIADIIQWGQHITPNGLKVQLEQLHSHPNSDGLKQFFTAIMRLGPDELKPVIDEAIANAQPRTKEDPVFDWVSRIAMYYPNDVGILAPIILNLVQLEPGQAIFLPARTLHAYLDGTGIELMANSDNVLRGGATPKHIDVPELLNTLIFEDQDTEIRIPRSISKNEKEYVTPAQEFALSVIDLNENELYQSPELQSVEIILCTNGQTTFKPPHTQPSVNIQHGESIIIPAAVNNYFIEGCGTLYKASVPV